MRYAGWIPSVLGRLSFTTYRSELLGTSQKDSLDYIFEIEVRDLLDSISLLSPSTQAGRYLREHIAQRFLGISGRFVFVFIAKFDEANDKLVGEVRVVAESKHSNYVKSLKGIGHIDTSSFKRAGEFLEVNTPDDLDRRGYWKLGVEISRTGAVQIDSGLESNDPKAREADLVVAEQVYYFLKDLFHNHQHHDPKSDSLISIALVNERNPTAWLDAVHHSLFRSIIRYKRYQTERHISKSLGILAYTKAFEKTFKSHADFKEFQTDQLKESLRVAQDDARNSRLVKASFAESVRNSFFAFFAFLVSISILLRFTDQPDIEVDQTILTVSTLVIENFWESLSVVGILAFIVGLITHSLEPADFRLVRGLTRAFQGFRMRYYIIANLIVTAILVTIGWALLF